MYTLTFIRHAFEDTFTYPTYDEAKANFDRFVGRIKDGKTEVIGLVLKDYNEGIVITYNA